MKKIPVILLLMALLHTAACTEVDICTEQQHPHFATVSYSFDWTEHGGSRPDSLYVIAYRVINMWKTSMIVDRQTLSGIYHYNAPTPELADTSRLTSFPVPGGEYKFMAFNQSGLELDYKFVEQFSTNPDMSLNELNVSYRTYRKNDPLLVRTIPDWADYNPYSNYMQPDVSTISFDTVSTTTMSPNMHRMVNFRLHPVTQSVDVYFDVKKDIADNKFRVDSVFGEVSGVPFTINLFNGYIDIRRTCKMMFRCELQNKDGSRLSADNDNSTDVRCHGTLSVPTIVQSQSPTVFTGPGIMQVVICCSTPNPDYPVSSAKPRINKKFQGIINLYNTLGKAQLYKYTTDGRHVVQNGQHQQLVIETPMNVNGKMVLESSDDNGGVDLWKSTLPDTILVHI